MQLLATGTSAHYKAVLLLVLTSWAAAQTTSAPVEVRNLQVLRDGSETKVEVTLSAMVSPSVAVATEPDRLVLVLPNTLSSARQQHVSVNENGVRRVRMGLNNTHPLVTRVVVDLDEARLYALTVDGKKITLTIRPPSPVGSESGVAANRQTVSAQPRERALPQRDLPPGAVSSLPATPTPSTNALAEAEAVHASPSMGNGAEHVVQNLTITGIIRSGNVPVPGATVTATNAANGQKIVGWTALDGSYAIQVPTAGHYRIQAEMIAFAPATLEVDAKDPSTRVEIEIVLATRGEQLAAEAETRRAAGNHGFQSLSVVEGEAARNLGNSGAGEEVAPPGMPVPGVDQNSATESISYSGTTGSFLISGDELQQRTREARDQQGERGQPGEPSGLMPAGQPGGTDPTALAPRGHGSAGGSSGGLPGLSGGSKMAMLGGHGRFDNNRPHGGFYYAVGDSALNAAPYSLTGNASSKPTYRQQKFGATIGWPLGIPKIYKGGAKTFFFANYKGSRGENPFDAFSTVPGDLQRLGNFAALCQTGFDSNGICNDRDSRGNLIHQIYDPCGGSFNAQGGCTSTSATPTPFAGNVIPATRINSAAAGLLKFIPLANLPGTVKNFHYLTATTNNSDDLNFRVMQALGDSVIRPAGHRHGSAQNNLIFGLHYHSAAIALANPYPSVGGNTNIRSFDIPVGYIRSFGKLTNTARVDFNRSRMATENLYAFSQNITGDLGITGVSQNPLDWGLPNISLTHFGSIHDTKPWLSRNQTLAFSDAMIWNHGKHTWRWGGDFRRIQLNTKASNDARGTFVFTGANSGYDFADFLLALPQQTQVQFGQDAYHFRGNAWNVFGQDDWKVRGNLTLNLGIRYEYVSPFTETNNRIANLDLSPGVLNPALGTPALVLVLPGMTGPYSGHFPATLLRADRNNFAPRLGLAWKLLSKTVVRAGYGINYNTGAYQTIAQQLAFQPPFSTTQTNPQSYPGQLTLQQGFLTSGPSGITNNYAVNPNYRLGYLEILNLDIQREIRPTLIFNLDYTGTKGTGLDVVEAPNRCIAGQADCATNGIRIPGVQAFNWQTSAGNSSTHAASVRLRKRLQHGISMGGTYTFSKALDDASSIGGGTTVVAQNPFDIAAERGLSIFDQRHRFTGDYLIELPFGHDKLWLNRNSLLRALFGDWQWSGDWTIASGVPFSPRILGDFADVSRGTNGTLRPDIVPGQSISLADPSIHEWFNTSAFVAPPFGHYGNARRNSIEGPGARLFDMAFSKVIPVGESPLLEVRVQFSNIFNTPQYTTIDPILNSPSYGQVIAVGAMRTIQFTIRFWF